MGTRSTTGFALFVGAALLAVAGWRANSSEHHVVLEPEPSELGQGECPSALGPPMVRLPEGFCIDTTEVTRAQYRAWLETSPATAGQRAECASNDDFEPECSFDRDEEHPVVCVDWCDAAAFCQAAGKRLCGGIEDGGDYDPADYADPAVSEWHAACSSGGAHEYTYGDDVDTQVCRGGDAEDFMTWGLGDAGGFDGCQSPLADYADLRDMSGNAAEWEASCDDEGCRIRGGSYEHQGVGLRCAAARDLRWPRMRAFRSVGFRCCAD